MPLFRYKASNKEGTMLRGTVEASDADRAFDLVHERGLIVVHLEEEQKFWSWKRTLETIFFVRIRDLLVMFRQLSLLVASGIPLVKSLDTVARQARTARFSAILLDIKNEVESGNPFSQALNRYPRVFSFFIVNMIEAGERSGQLDRILEYITNKEEEDYLLFSKIHSVLLYPLIVLFFLILITLLLFIFIVPRFVDFFAGFGSNLPWITKLFIVLSEWLIQWFPAIFIMFFGSVFAFGIFSRTLNGRRIWHSMLLKTPIFGRVIPKIFAVRFSQSLAVLLKGGVPLVTSLHIVSHVVNQAVYEDILNEVIKQVEDGNSFAEQLSKRKEIPAMVAQMVAIGEETGRLAETLEKLSHFYIEETDASLRTLVSFIAPTVIVLLGIGVGFIMIAILFPMYHLVSEL